MTTTPATMRALVFDGPASDTRASRVADDVPLPQPGPGEITVDVRYSGVNFKGVMARRGDPGYVAGWPFVPGLEAAGTVRALGPGVEGFAEGDRVTAFTDAGGLARSRPSRSAISPHPPQASARRPDLSASVFLASVFPRRASCATGAYPGAALPGKVKRAEVKGG